MMRLYKMLCVLLLSGCGAAWGAGSTPPTPPFTQCPPIGANTSCGILIVITDAGVTAYQDPNMGPYDGDDDTLIGIVNNSSKTVQSLPLSSSTPIFGFDGDGVCTYITCTWASPTGYEGPITTYSSISADQTSGIVNFTGGLAPGQSTWFSLELSISLSNTCTNNVAKLYQYSTPWNTDTYDHLYVTKTYSDAGSTAAVSVSTLELTIFANPAGQPGPTGATNYSLSLSTKTLNDIQSAINKLGVAGLSASVVASGTRFQLSITPPNGTNAVELRTTAGSAASNILKNINAKGCYLTSAAMLINFYAGKQVTDPRDLNNRLNAMAAGYCAGAVHPAAVAAVARNQLGVTMYFDRATTSQDDLALKSALCNGDPPLMQVAGTPMHFVLATGQATVSGQATYNINDPGFSATTLIDPVHSYNNTYTGLRLFSSKSGNANALVACAHSPVELLLTDNGGNTAGYTSGGTVVNIPGSSYYNESIQDDVDPVNEPPTDNVKNVYVSGAPSGTYQLKVMGTGFGPYTIDVVAFDSSGQSQIQSVTGTATTGSLNTYTIAYSTTPGTPLSVKTQSSAPVLTIAKTHAGAFSQGQTGATYTITVGNQGGSPPTTGTVTVTESVPAGLSLTSMSGSAWTCSGTACSRNDVLNGGASYPPISVVVNVASTAPSQVTNSATVTGGGSAAATANDTTAISAPAPGVAVGPVAGSGNSQTFTVMAADAGGVASVGMAGLLINSSLSQTNACLVEYLQGSNSIVLANDANTSWLGPYTAGSSSVASNSQCSVTVAGVAVSAQGNTLSVNIPVSFKPGFAGTKTVWGVASDKNNVSSGYQQTGTFKVTTKFSQIGGFNPKQAVFLLDQNANLIWDGTSIDALFPWGTANHNPSYIVVTGDWNGSGSKKVGIYDPATAIWLLDYNGDGVYTPGVDKYFVWGSPGDIPVVGDWNGSGTTKIGTFGPNTSLWLLDYNGNFAWDGPNTDKYFPWGSAGDTPVVGDWNGSGASKVGTFGPKTGLWLLDYNGNSVWDGKAVDKYFPWGSPGDTPMVGDWNGSGTSKVGTFGPKTGLWLLDYNGNFAWDGSTADKYFPWGSPGDTPLVGDWNGSGTTKVATFGPGTALWLLDFNGNFNWDGAATDKYFPWGSPGDTPIVRK
jgi:uncharacterized repeat protein (TIGR01451 family)